MAQNQVFLSCKEKSRLNSNLLGILALEIFYSQIEVLSLQLLANLAYLRAQVM
jgi:hypothetical protein